MIGIAILFRSESGLWSQLRKQCFTQPRSSSVAERSYIGEGEPALHHHALEEIAAEHAVCITEPLVESERVGV